MHYNAEKKRFQVHLSENPGWNGFQVGISHRSHHPLKIPYQCVIYEDWACLYNHTATRSNFFGSKTRGRACLLHIHILDSKPIKWTFCFRAATSSFTAAIITVAAEHVARAIPTTRSGDSVILAPAIVVRPAAHGICIWHQQSDHDDKWNCNGDLGYSHRRFGWIAECRMTRNLFWWVRSNPLSQG